LPRYLPRAWQTDLVRTILLGVILFTLLAVSILSLRPGGLRAQFRNVVRRLRLALILLGVYLLVSGALRVAFPDALWAELAVVGIALALALAFVVLGQDRQLEP
jgi:Ca2+/H+ antiporter